MPKKKTNLEIFYTLTDSLVDKICSELPQSEKNLLLTLNLGQSYFLFSNNIKDRFGENGKEILQLSSGDLDNPEINIVLEGAGVEYGEMFRDGWFGHTLHSTLLHNFRKLF